MVALPSAASELLGSVAPPASFLESRGVKVLVLVSRGVPPVSLRKLAKLTEIRVRDRMFGGGAIFDGNEVVLLLGMEEKGLALAIWSDNLGLVRLAEDYFDYLWRDAAPYSVVK